MKVALPYVRQLEETASLFYEVRPEKLQSATRDIAGLLQERSPGLVQEMSDLASVLEQGASQENNYEAFLVRVPAIRERLLGILKTNVRDSGQRADILVSDAVLSGLFKKCLPAYVDTHMRPKLANGTLSQDGAQKFLQVFEATVASGILEGENQSIEKDMQVFKRLAPDNFPDNATVHGARLKLGLIRHKINTEWGRFMDIAQPEMVQMLERMGSTYKDAVAKVYATDLVEFRKSSYSFYLEDLMDPVAAVLERLEETVEKIPGQQEVLGYEKVFKGDALRKPEGLPLEIDVYLDAQITALPKAGTLTEIDKSLSTLSHSSAAQAEKLCRIFVDGYLDKTSLDRNVAIITEGDKRIELYPYSLYGVDAVVITVNGEVVPDPLSFIKERYKAKIVPAMIHALREGD